MKTTGITRRIDELGRVVIPKELRKNMHIKAGELLEIYLVDSETISLKKHSILNDNLSFLQNFIKVIGKKLDSEIYVTNLDKIMFSTDQNAVDKLISTELENHMKCVDTLKNVNKIVLYDNYVIENNIKIYSISPNGDIAGIIIFSLKKKPDEKVLDIMKFFTNFLESYLEEN